MRLTLIDAIRVPIDASPRLRTAAAELARSDWEGNTK